MSTYLDSIGEYHRARARSDARAWRDRMDGTWCSAPSLARALRTGPNVAVIAEVKRRSPSKGWLNPQLDSAVQAALYETAGAAAVSVLTDTPHFGGSLEDLERARAAVQIPLLRKDFTLSENDVLDAVEYGASAILLIVALLNDDELTRLHSLARTVNLEVLVEVHDEREASRALAAGAEIIGVNQRDLHTFEVDVARAARVGAALPEGVVRVAESGLAQPSDVARAGSAGFHAVLVGESYVTDSHPVERVRTFCDVART